MRKFLLVFGLSFATPVIAADPPGPLSPAESKKSFHVADDLVFEQVLAEPVITQPVFLTFDERGRMWVVEYRQYPEPAGLKMVSRDKFWRAVYDRVPEPPPRGVRGADRITIHEDTKGDGTFDQHKTFVDGLNIATSVAFGRGGVFVLNPPYLLFYPDANRDDVPDGDPKVLLSGFGLEDTHSVANSLRWGPDGWLYGCQGSTVTGNILVYGADGKVLEMDDSLSPGAPGERAGVRAGSTHLSSKSAGRRPMLPIYSQGQNIWRYHPEKRMYEVFSEGGGNAFGLEIDSAGRIFSGHNGGNTRGFHYMQGAYLQKGFDKHGPLSNPYAFGYFPAMPHPDVDRFTHNFLIYDSGALGDRYEGKLFGVEPLQGRIVMSEITPDGSTFRTRDLGYPVTSDDPWFRPVDIKLGPDGAIYVCDWYDGQVNHFRNHEGQMDAGNGRIYRLRAKGTRLEASPKLLPPPSSIRDLALGLTHPNRSVRQQTLRLIADRRGERLPLDLDESIRRSDERTALEALWALNLNGAFDEALAEMALRQGGPQLRAWTVRLLGDEKHVSPAIAKQLADLAATEPNIEVRTQLACTAKRLPAADALPVVRNLLARDPDATDPRQPLLLWWAIERHAAHVVPPHVVPPSGGKNDGQSTTVDSTPVRPVTPPPAEAGTTYPYLFADRELWRAPIVQNTILSRLMRRFAATGKREDLLTCAKLFALSPGPEQTAKLTQGFEEAYQGRPMAGLPEELLLAMELAGGESVLLGTRRGKPAAVEQALAAIADPKADASKRLQLIQVFGETKQPQAVPVLLAIARDAKPPELRKAALGALQAYDSGDIATEVLTQFASYPTEVRSAALGLLTSRPVWSLALVQAVDAGRLDKSAVPNDAVRRLHAVGADVRRLTIPSPDAATTLSQNVKPEPSLPTSSPTNEIGRLVAKLWPNVRQATSAELEQEITRLSEVINLTTGSPYAGKKLFVNSCGVCHKLFNRGTEVGPDLTTYQRTDLGNLLLNVVNPNAEIREGYENFTVETRDGRLLTGFLADHDPQVVILRTPDGQTVPLSRAEIIKLEPAGTSLMPEGLLAGLSDQQLRDLFAYLRSTQPLNDGN